jgi:Rps23 Pro-64 3,4-dihydroxylase Tpa1-like proline 4-hydroxylase
MNSPELQLVSLEAFSEPFPYFTARDGLPHETAMALLEWLEESAPWKLVETDFYEQYEFSLLDVALPADLKFLAKEPFLGSLKRDIELIFGVELSCRADCTAHKLVHGQRIRIHNDWIPGAETHRVLIQLNRGWQQEHGGILMLFNSSEASDVHCVLPPISESIVGFAISEKSHHAVSTIYSGERFTLVFSFYAAYKS